MSQRFAKLEAANRPALDRISLHSFEAGPVWTGIVFLGSLNSAVRCEYQCVCEQVDVCKCEALQRRKFSSARLKKKEREKVFQAILFWTLRFICISVHVCEVCNTSSAEGQICCCSLDPPLSYKASTLSLKGRAFTLLHCTFTHTLNRSFPINQHLKDSH